MDLASGDDGRGGKLVCRRLGRRHRRAQVEALGGPDKFAQKVSGGRNKNWNDWVRKSLTILGKPVPVEDKKAS